MGNRRLLILTFSTVFGTVLIVFILKGAFLITRYGITATRSQCEKSHNHTESDANHEYIFTVIVYVVVSLLRILEYVLLAKQFYAFLLQQSVTDSSEFFKIHLRRFCYLLLFSAILLPYFLLGFTIPGLGIYQEIERSGRQCYQDYSYEIYITYCAVNFLRYISAYAVRIMMIFTVLSLNKIWFPDGSLKHTSIGLVKNTDGCEGTTNEDTESSAVQETATRGPGSTGLNSDSDNNENCDNIDHQVFQKVLDDWKSVSTDYQRRAYRYAKIGKEVQEILELFQTWFIVPWVIYILVSYLKTYNILRPWNTDGDGDIPPSNIPQLYYLFYNINQFVTLILPYLCAKQINTYHQKYFTIMRNSQLKKFEDDPSRLSFARQLLIEQNGGYDFVPRIVGTSITISVGSPLYVVILLVGIFLSVSKTIFQS